MLVLTSRHPTCPPIEPTFTLTNRHLTSEHLNIRHHYYSDSRSSSHIRCVKRPTGWPEANPARKKVGAHGGRKIVPPRLQGSFGPVARIGLVQLAVWWVAHEESGSAGFRYSLLGDSR
jgi:hypothetical protein